MATSALRQGPHLVRSPMEQRLTDARVGSIEYDNYFGYHISLQFKSKPKIDTKEIIDLYNKKQGESTSRGNKSCELVALQFERSNGLYIIGIRPLKRTDNTGNTDEFVHSMAEDILNMVDSKRRQNKPVRLRT